MSANVTLSSLNSSDRGVDETLQQDGAMQKTNVVISAIILVVIFVVSLAGNMSVFLIFYRKPALMTISNRFIVNLSVCNVLETVLVMPFVFFALVSQTWSFGDHLCQIMGFLMNAIFAASTLTLVVIAIDRYCAIVTPLHYTVKITKRRARAMIAFVWLLAVCCSLPPLFGWNRYEYQRKKSVCTAVADSHDLNDRLFTFFLVVLCFIIPLIIILWAYCVIFMAARNNSEKVRRNSLMTNPAEEIIQAPYSNSRRASSIPILVHRLSTSSRANGQIWQRDEWKAAVTSGLVVFTFIVCWLLYFIIIVIECMSEGPDEIRPVIKTVSILLAMSSSALNPVVYVFRGKTHRVTLKVMLGLPIKETSPGRQILHGTNIIPFSRTPCLSRQGSEESEIIQKLHHVTTATTLTSMMVAEEMENLETSRR